MFFGGVKSITFMQWKSVDLNKETRSLHKIFTCFFTRHVDVPSFVLSSSIRIQCKLESILEVLPNIKNALWLETQTNKKKSFLVLGGVRVYQFHAMKGVGSNQEAHSLDKIFTCFFTSPVDVPSFVLSSSSSHSM